MKRHYAKWVGAAGMAVAIVLADAAGFLAPVVSLVGEAEARIGRPATPGSVAGVARRTTRRVIRRSTIYVATLPAACVRTTINGVAVWSCGGTYYQSYGGRYVVIYVD